jgi:ligand-binding SRPBCC domain-containing protein
MTSAVTAYDYPNRFVDEQQRGPFGRWGHEHLFAALPDGTVLDAARRGVPVPLGLLGSAADRAGA